MAAAICHLVEWQSTPCEHFDITLQLKLFLILKQSPPISPDRSSPDSHSLHARMPPPLLMKIASRPRPSTTCRSVVTASPSSAAF